jgi:hypothetical protein
MLGRQPVLREPGQRNTDRHGSLRMTLAQPQPGLDDLHQHQV